MNKEEVFDLIKRKRIEKKRAIVLIADFLVKSKKEAKEIYENEFENQI